MFAALALIAAMALSDGARAWDKLLELAPEQRRAAVLKLSAEDQQAVYLALKHDWRRWARPEQLPPADLDPWDVFVLLAGRGAGKTRPASQLINYWAHHPEEYSNGDLPRFILVAKDDKNVREVMVDGESGILACAPPWGPQPVHEPSKKRIVWYDRGREVVRAELHTAEAPKTLRGPQAHKGWGDEFGAWKAKPGAAPDAWTNGLDMCVRLGRRPQTILTSTPTPSDFFAELCYGPKLPGKSKRLITAQDLVAADRGGWAQWHFDIKDGDGTFERTVVHQWPTSRNRGNLPPGKVAKWYAKYAGTRLGQAELEGLILDRVENALFSLERFLATRKAAAPPLVIKAVAVDPTRSQRPVHECGIMAGGRGKDGHGYLLADCTVKGSPDVWAAAAISAYHKFGAQFLVYENSGMGLSMRRTIETRDRSVNWVSVPSTEDKASRAAPISALYEQGRIHHVVENDDENPFDIMEAEMAGWDPVAQPRYSPNRLDADVLLFTALLLGLPKESPLVAPVSITKGER